MEKLQPFIAGVKKYNFWIVLSLVCMLLLYFWMETTPSFEKPFKKEVSKLKGHFGTLGKLKGRGEYPNDVWIKARDEARGEIDQRLAQVARDNYGEQRAAREWGDFEEVSADSRLNKDELSRYWREFLSEEVKNLKKIVDASVDENATGQLIWKRDDFASIADKLTPDELVKYRATQARLKEDLADDERKEAEDAIKKTVWPGTERVIATQEIVWVYQTLLRAVASVNDRPGVDKFNLPIRAIEKIDVWADAATQNNGVTALATRRVRRPGPKAATPSGGKGIKIPDVKEYYRVVPVRLEVQMDHQYLASLLVALANEPLTCEVVDLELTSSPVFKKKAKPAPRRTAGAVRPGLRRGLGGQGAAKPQAAPEQPQVVQPRGKRTVVELLIYLAKPPAKNAA